MKERMVPEQEVSELSDEMVRLAAAKDAEIAELSDGVAMLHRQLAFSNAEIAALTEQRDELRRQDAEKADLLDRCIALFRKNGDYPTLTQEIVAALTSAPQDFLNAEAETAPSLPETP